MQTLCVLLIWNVNKLGYTKIRKGTLEMFPVLDKLVGETDFICHETNTVGI